MNLKLWSGIPVLASLGAICFCLDSSVSSLNPLSWFIWSVLFHDQSMMLSALHMWLQLILRADKEKHLVNVLNTVGHRGLKDCTNTLKGHRYNYSCDLKGLTLRIKTLHSFSLRACPKRQTHTNFPQLILLLRWIRLTSHPEFIINSNDTRNAG